MKSITVFVFSILMCLTAGNEYYLYPTTTDTTPGSTPSTPEGYGYNNKDYKHDEDKKLEPKDIKQGDATFYDIQVGLTACGTSHQNSEFVAATSFSYWTNANPNMDIMCEKFVKITNPANGQQITVPVNDKCFSCTPNDLDLTPSAFMALGVDLSVGRFKIEWDFTTSANVRKPCC